MPFLGKGALLGDTSSLRRKGVNGHECRRSINRVDGRSASQRSGQKPAISAARTPGSPIQVVGAGRLSEHEQQILTDEERRDLVQ
jgi:hypothetical protein